MLTVQSPVWGGFLSCGGFSIRLALLPAKFVSQSAADERRGQKLSSNIGF
jgi:hypothetical protein